MQGFDPKFRDFPDYIIGITKEIWEDRGIATLHDYYAPDIVVRSPASGVPDQITSSPNRVRSGNSANVAIVAAITP